MSMRRHIRSPAATRSTRSGSSGSSPTPSRSTSRTAIRTDRFTLAELEPALDQVQTRATSCSSTPDNARNYGTETLLDGLVVSGRRRRASADRARHLRDRLRRAERRSRRLDDVRPPSHLARRGPDDPRERHQPRPAPRARAGRRRADEGRGGERRARPHLRSAPRLEEDRWNARQDSIGELRHGILSVVDALAQSVALLSLALGVAFASSAAAGEAGIAAPFAYLIAGVGSLCLASVIIRFTRRMASAGGLYTYISRGLNPSAGFLGGWLYGGGFAVGISFVLVIGSFFMSIAMTRAHEPALGLVRLVLHLPRGARAARVPRHPHLDAHPAHRRRGRRRRDPAARDRDRGQGRRLRLHVRAAQPGERDVDEQPVPRGRAHVHRASSASRQPPCSARRRRTRCGRSRRRSSPPSLVALVYYVFVTWMMGVGFGARMPASGRRTRRRSTRSRRATSATGSP